MLTRLLQPLRWRHARCAPWRLDRLRRPTLSLPAAPTNATTSPTASSTQSAAASSSSSSSSSSTKAIIGDAIGSVIGNVADSALGAAATYFFVYRPRKRKQGEVSAGGKLPLQSTDVPPAEQYRQEEEDGRRIHEADASALARGSR